MRRGERRNLPGQRALLLVFSSFASISLTSEEPVSLDDLIRSIGPLSATTLKAANRRLDLLTKPKGSLGQLEEWVARYCAIFGKLPPPEFRPAVVVFAADHGITEEGVSPYPSEVTAQMVENFLRGGAAVNAFSQEAGAEILVVDVGVKGDLARNDKLLDRKIGRGTKNFLNSPAMSVANAERALRTGYEIAQELAKNGTTALALGEMGIGNTTSAATISAGILKLTAADLTGPGAGLNKQGMAIKRGVVARALERAGNIWENPLQIIAEVGGFEIGALAGAILGGASARIALFVDGYVGTAAALLARVLCPTAMDYCFPAHLSAEPGHRLQLESLGWKPPIRMEMRLGEGTGAILATGLMRSALRAFREMSTFEEAGVSGRELKKRLDSKEMER